jgi:acyl-coenzyme A thioesterase PaaI-like protein
MSATKSPHPASLQERYAPESICFGCGPVNTKGLRIRTMTVSDDSDEVVLDWTPEPHHQAFEGIVNGGILGSLLDCHSNWAAAWHLKRRDNLEGTPVTVTADFHVTLTRPTPADKPMRIDARATQSEGSWVTVEAEVVSDGQVTARCTGRFVAVKAGHPAYEASPHAAKGTPRPAIGD